ncbi:MAG: hypothetical protein LBL04_09665 [Bacteroidales bacterium]|jgi:hypothetical protein|nr:hypothetical protein [Bacteroidales bacterium]
MDENKNFPEEFEETPWIYPLVNKRTVDIPEMAAEVAKRTGIEVSKVEEYIRLYNDAVMQHLREGKTVFYLDMGYLVPELDEDGKLVAYSFEVSEEIQQRLEDNMHKNPSLN